ncbi:MAG: glycosyltransferase family 2 protein [Collimonas sp.]|uniref:glycosyltransferase family 2 protein n=1 Tax=Collimonas sp. TaxID=1963772 RepID=UPI0032659A15
MMRPEKFDSGQSVCAVIVTYNPEKDALNRLIAAIKRQVKWIVVIDNASNNSVADIVEDADVLYLPSPKNEGIAGGQNRGIEWAIKNDATHVLIFDQDSEPEHDMLEKLLLAESRLIELGHEVAAVGPSYIDVKSGEISPFTSLEGWHIRNKFSPDFENYTEALCLISSGQLIRCAVIHKVGAMREDLFIDFVDIEWGLRAGAKGYKSFGVFNAHMNHNFGDSYVKIGKKTLSLHSPLRHYYIMRNSILMYRANYIPLGWKIADGIKFFKRFLSYIIFSENKFEHLKWMMFGIKDGLIGRAGKYGENTRI